MCSQRVQRTLSVRVIGELARVPATSRCRPRPIAFMSRGVAAITRASLGSSSTSKQIMLSDFAQSLRHCGLVSEQRVPSNQASLPSAPTAATRPPSIPKGSHCVSVPPTKVSVESRNALAFRAALRALGSRFPSKLWLFVGECERSQVLALCVVTGLAHAVARQKMALLVRNRDERGFVDSRPRIFAGRPPQTRRSACRTLPQTRHSRRPAQRL